MVLPLRRIVLTNITSNDAFDVICFHSHFSWNAFKEYVNRMGIGYEKLDEDRAAKILVSQGGVGYGCYTMYSVVNNKNSIQQYRSALAKSKKTTIAEITGVCSVFDAVELVIESEATLIPPEVRNGLYEAPRRLLRAVATGAYRSIGRKL